MIEQLVKTISQEGGMAVSILLLVIIGIVWYVRQVDKRNMEITEFRIHRYNIEVYHKIGFENIL